MNVFNFLKTNKDEHHVPTISNLGYTPISNNFQPLYKNHPDAIFTLDVSGNILHYNESVNRIFGYNDKEIKRDFCRFLEGNSRAKRKMCIENVLKGAAQQFKANVFHKNGKLIVVDVTYIPIMDSEQNVAEIFGIAKDITSYVHSQKELEKIKSSFELAQNIGKIGSWDYDIIEDEAYWSNQMYKFFGIDNRDHFVPTYNILFEYIHPDDAENFRHIVEHAFANRQSYSLEYRIVRKDGSITYVYEQADVIEDENQEPVRAIGITQDITTRKNAEVELLERKQRSENIFNHLEAGIWSYDVENKLFLLISQGVKQITGYTRDEFMEGVSWKSIIHPEDFPTFKKLQSKLAEGKSLHHKYRIINKNGQVIWIQDQTLPILNSDGSLKRIDSIVTNITEQKEYEETIKHFAYHDYLTNLPNKRLFEEELDSLINEKANKKFALMYIDLDGFKRINDSLGHLTGDKLLKDISSRLAGCTTNNDFVARISGDKFILLMKDMEELEQAISAAQKVISTVEEPYCIEAYELFITASIGISIYPDDGNDAQTLLQRADRALYRAKELGKNNFQVYTSTMNFESFKLYSLEKGLRKAIKSDELFLHYQPKVNCKTGKMVGAEALIRWQHPQWGLVSPEEFVPLAEENDLIFKITDWTLYTVCEQIKKWEALNIPIKPISINLSPKRFLRNDWSESLLQIIEKTKVNPSLLEFEITESALIQNEASFIASIDMLKEKGITFSLDDFGTGYSSLLYLKKFKFDTVKIDRNFITDFLIESDTTIAKSIISLAKGLGLNIVAEGVETMEQLTFLRQQGCDQVQGYLYSKPVPVEEFSKLLIKPLLKPAKNKLQKPINERRKVFRVVLPFPLSANMSLAQINGKSVKVGKTEVLIEDIGIGGLRFLTHINLPVNPEIILEFDTKILGETIQLPGTVVWKQEIEDNFFQYGIQFNSSVTEDSPILPLLNKLTIQLKKNSIPAECDFIKGEKISYLKKISNK